MTVDIPEPLSEEEQRANFKAATGSNGTDEPRSRPEQDTRKQYYIQRYSEPGLLAEAIIIDGLPRFLVSRNGTSSGICGTCITVQERLELADKVINPPAQEAYANQPYFFVGQELKSLLEETQHLTLSRLYEKVKGQWSTFIDADDFHLSICAADTVFTYFQDKIGMTHYLWFVGNNGSGKSNNLRVLNLLGYRNMMTTDMTAANIYQFLGSFQEGQGTLCEDEADNIENEHNKMRIYKNGYINGTPVMRTDTSNGRKQERFFTFCFKAAAAEKLPDGMKAKGLLERVIPLPCFHGFPKHDITEVVNPAGDVEAERLLAALFHTRKQLLLFKLLHYHDCLPRLKLNIYGRENQLFGGLLRLFQGTPSMQELSSMISKYISERREAKANSLHAALYRLIKELTNSEGHTLEVARIWAALKDSLEGSDVQGHLQSYDSVEYGRLSQKRVVETLCDILGAKRDKNKSKKARTLVFDLVRLDKLGIIYDVDMQVQVKEEKGPDGTLGTLDATMHSAGQQNEHMNPAESSPQNSESSTASPRETTQSVLRGTLLQGKEPSQSVQCVPSVPCPYCLKCFTSLDEAATHSIMSHPGRPFMQDIRTEGQEGV